MDACTRDEAVINELAPEIQNEPPPPVDAVIRVTISDSRLESYICIEPPENGGAAPSLEALEAALSSCGVTYNVNKEKLSELAAKPVYNLNVLVSSGVTPEDGVDGTAFFRIETEKSALKPRENEAGIVDYRDLGIAKNVAKGQVLCDISLPTEGSPGVSVKGEQLKQNKGRPVPCFLGINTVLNESGTAVLSKIDGQVEFDGRKINVNETFYVKENVDNSTGSIKVVGNLVVRGMVLPGFVIEAGRNIEVYGTVEAATIKAGGDVKLQSGITNSELYCEGSLKSRFIENCGVFVKGDVTAEYILNSNIKCGKNLKILGLIAKIIGGSCVVGQNIEAKTIGSVASVKTRLELGTDPAIIDRQQQLLAQAPELEKQIDRLKPLVTLLRQLEGMNRLTPEKKEILDNVSYSYDANMKALLECKRELEEISRSIKLKGYGRVICTGTIFPGTKVVMGAAKLSVTDALNNVSLFYSEGNIFQGSAR